MMFDSQGNLLEIGDMPFAERMAVAGYQIVEAFTRVRRATGFEDPVPIRRTKKVKFVDRHKFAVIYGKMMGYFSDEPPVTDDSLKSLTVVFVNLKGERVDPKMIQPTKPPRVLEHDPPSIGIKFVR